MVKEDDIILQYKTSSSQDLNSNVTGIIMLKSKIVFAKPHDSVFPWKRTGFNSGIALNRYKILSPFRPLKLMFDQQGLAKLDEAVLHNRVTPRHFAFGHPLSVLTLWF